MTPSLDPRHTLHCLVCPHGSSHRRAHRCRNRYDRHCPRGPSFSGDDLTACGSSAATRSHAGGLRAGPAVHRRLEAIDIDGRPEGGRRRGAIDSDPSTASRLAPGGTHAFNELASFLQWYFVLLPTQQAPQLRFDVHAQQEFLGQVLSEENLMRIRTLTSAFLDATRPRSRPGNRITADARVLAAAGAGTSHTTSPSHHPPLDR
jgi:hypothetical protein